MDLTPETLSPLLGFPIQAPPPGVTPNFTNPESTAYQVYITAGICVPLILIFFGIRFISKFYIGRRTVVIVDEVIFIIGVVLCLAFIGMTIACVSGGAFGRQAWNVLLGAFTKSQLVLSLLVQIFLPLALCSVKISVLILYLQIFSILKWMRVAAIGGIVAITAFHVGLAIAFAAMCSPTTGDSHLDFLAAFVSRTCSRSRVLVVVQGIGNVVTDFFLLILPLPAVWTLQAPLKRKIAISSMFLVGISACASSLLSLAYRVDFYRAGQNNIRIVVPLWVTAIAEETAGVMICCMPTMPLLLKSIKAPILSWVSSTSKKVLRLTGSSRSASALSLSGGDDSAFQVSLERHDSGGSRNPIHPYRGHLGQHTAWVDTQVSKHDVQDLQRLRPNDIGIGMKTEIQVSRMI